MTPMEGIEELEGRGRGSWPDPAEGGFRVTFYRTDGIGRYEYAFNVENTLPILESVKQLAEEHLEEGQEYLAVTTFSDGSGSIHRVLPPPPQRARFAVKPYNYRG